MIDRTRPMLCARRALVTATALALASCTVPGAPDGGADATANSDRATSAMGDVVTDRGPGRSASCGRVSGDGGARMDSSIAVDADAAAIAPGAACDLIDPRCAEGEGCYPAATGPGGRCEPRGVASEGAECSTNSECRPSLLCDLPAMGPGVCRALCCPGAATGCFDSTCVALIDRDYGICVAGANCTSFSSTGADASATSCTAGQACYIVSSDGRVACLPQGQRARGDACDRVNACATGLSCLRVNGMPPRCIPMCDARDGRGCAENEVCRALATGTAAVCEPR